MKRFLLFIVLIIFPLSFSVGQDVRFALKEGDLLFQDLDCGDFCDAIEKVTEGVDGLDFSHLGIAVKSKRGEWEILEAVSAGVKKTPLEEFLFRNVDPKGLPLVVVGRLKDVYQPLIPVALKESENYIGKPYDETFDITNDRYYCSELVYYLFKKANGSQPLFDLEPMTFKDPETGATFQIWEDYYRELNGSIPEGEPGLNPGGISRSDALEIFYPYSQFE